MKDWTTPRVRLIGAAIVLMVIGVTFTLVPWRIAEGPMRAEAERRLRLALDAPDATFGKMSLVLLPMPKLKVSDIAFAQGGGGLSGTIAKANFSLKIAPLVRGVPKPTGVALIGPVVTARLTTVSDRPFHDAQAFVGIVTRRLAEQGSLAGMTEVDVENGHLSLVRTNGGANEEISAIEIHASLPAPERPLRLAFTGRHRGEEMKLSFSGASPKALRSGVTEPVSVSYRSPGWVFDFVGTGSLLREPSLKGTLNTTLNDHRRAPFAPAMALVGMDTAAPIAMRAAIEANARGATLADLSISSGRRRFDGVGSLRDDGQRWSVNATLATTQADFTAMFATSGYLRRKDESWNTAPIDLSPLFAANIDLRLSADVLNFGAHELHNAAMAVLSRANRIELSLSDATVYTGRAKARAIIARNADGLDVRSTANFDKIDIGAATLAAGLPKRVSGTGNVEIAWETSGTSIAQFVAQTEGRISATIRGGEINGIDLVRLANRRGARPDIMMAEALGGRTAFDSAVISAKIVRGVIGPVEGNMQAARLIGTLGGEIDLPRGDVALTGSVIQLPSDPTTQSDPRPVLDFTISGPLTEPRVAPDIASLLRRS